MHVTVKGYTLHVLVIVTSSKDISLYPIKFESLQVIVITKVDHIFKHESYCNFYIVSHFKFLSRH